MVKGVKSGSQALIIKVQSIKEARIPVKGWRLEERSTRCPMVNEVESQMIPFITMLRSNDRWCQMRSYNESSLRKHCDSGHINLFASNAPLHILYGSFIDRSSQRGKGDDYQSVFLIKGITEHQDSSAGIRKPLSPNTQLIAFVDSAW